MHDIIENYMEIVKMNMKRYDVHNEKKMFGTTLKELICNNGVSNHSQLVTVVNIFIKICIIRFY